MINQYTYFYYNQSNGETIRITRHQALTAINIHGIAYVTNASDEVQVSKEIGLANDNVIIILAWRVC